VPGSDANHAGSREIAVTAARAAAAKQAVDVTILDVHGLIVIIDYIDVVVHVFAQEEREYYDLERLWRDAPRLGWNATDQAAAGSLD